MPGLAWIGESTPLAKWWPKLLGLNFELYKSSAFFSILQPSQPSLKERRVVFLFARLSSALCIELCSSLLSRKRRRKPTWRPRHMARHGPFSLPFFIILRGKSQTVRAPQWRILAKDKNVNSLFFSSSQGEIWKTHVWTDSAFLKIKLKVAERASGHVQMVWVCHHSSLREAWHSFAANLSAVYWKDLERSGKIWKDLGAGYSEASDGWWAHSGGECESWTFCHWGTDWDAADMHRSELCEPSGFLLWFRGGYTTRLKWHTSICLGLSDTALVSRVLFDLFVCEIQLKKPTSGESLAAIICYLVCHQGLPDRFV